MYIYIYREREKYIWRETEREREREINRERARHTDTHTHTHRERERERTVYISYGMHTLMTRKVIKEAARPSSAEATNGSGFASTTPSAPAALARGSSLMEAVASSEAAPMGAR